jgi:putative transposase
MDAPGAHLKEAEALCRQGLERRHRFPRYPNLVKGMIISRLNQVWLSDITYIRIRTGFVYLAAILDAYSRKVIGYAVSGALDTALTLQALKMAIIERNPGVYAVYPVWGASPLQCFWQRWEIQPVSITSQLSSIGLELSRGPGNRLR